MGSYEGKSAASISSDEAEVGYWIGDPYWVQGLAPETVNEIIRHGFEDLKLKTMWCGYYDGNERSHCAQDKCGFIYHHTSKSVYVSAYE